MCVSTGLAIEVIEISNQPEPGFCLNIKLPSYQHRSFYVKDKTVSSTVLSLASESPYLGKTVLYWNGAHVHFLSLCKMAQIALFHEEHIL